jgi:hypothetical protein
MPNPERAFPVLFAAQALCAAALLALAPPASGPAGDDLLDWLLTKSTTSPATQTTDPASRPASPFADKADDRGARRAVMLLSNGERIGGKIATTRDKPIRVWIEADKEYRDIPYNLIKSVEAQVLWERDEAEWAFKESGSDIKIYSGKTYPCRELIYKVTLVNDQSITGGVVAPLYVLTSDGDRVFILHKRQKGEVDQKLNQLVYVKSVRFE